MTKFAYTCKYAYKYGISRKSALARGGFRVDDKTVLSKCLDRCVVGGVWSVAVSGASHQRHQQRRRSCLTQERMRQQLGGCGSLRWIANQHPIEESLQAGRHFVHVLQIGRFRVTNASHRLQRRLVKERRFAVDHLDYHDAQRPDVDLGSVRQPRDYLGRHPVRCAN